MSSPNSPGKCKKCRGECCKGYFDYIQQDRDKDRKHSSLSLLLSFMQSWTNNIRGEAEQFGKSNYRLEECRTELGVNRNIQLHRKEREER